VSRGGFYDADNAFEHVKAYLKPMFNFLGIEPEFVHADGINYGPEQREAGIANGLAEVERLAA
jgi:FMN-dependent NADH-azoreductase